MLTKVYAAKHDQGKYKTCKNVAILENNIKVYDFFQATMKKLEAFKNKVMTLLETTRV